MVTKSKTIGYSLPTTREGKAIFDPKTGERLVRRSRPSARERARLAGIERAALEEKLRLKSIATKKLEEEKKVREAKEKARKEADIKRKEEKLIITEEKAKTSAETKRLQQRYIASLRARPGADLEVQPYTGIKKPFGVKDITFLEPRFGTIGFEEEPFRKVSTFESLQRRERFDPDVSKPTQIIYQQEADRVINRIITTETGKANSNLRREQGKIQDKINRGLISAGEGDAEINRMVVATNLKLKEDVGAKFETEFRKVETSQRFQTKLKRSESFRGELEKFDPKLIKEKSKRRLETLADVGAIAVSTVVPPAGIAYFGGKGISQVARGSKEDIRLIDDPSKGIPLYPGLQPSELSQRGGANLLFGGLSGIGTARGIGAGITKLRGKALKDTPWSITGRQFYQEGDKTFLRISASKTTGVASAEAEMIIPVKVGRGGRFNIQQGEGKVETRIVDFLEQSRGKEGLKKSTLDFKTMGRGTFSKGFLRTPAGKIDIIDAGFGVTSGEGFVIPKSVQELSIRPTRKLARVSGRPFDTRVREGFDISWMRGGEPEPFLFGGVSKKTDTGMEFISGRLAKGRLYPQEGRVTGLFKREAFGEVITKKELAGRGFGVIKPAKIKKTPFTRDVQIQKQVQKEVYKSPLSTEGVGAGQQFVKPALSKAEEMALRQLPKTSMTGRTLVPLVSSTAKLKDKYQVDAKVDVGLSSKSISQGMELNPVTGFKSGQDFRSSQDFGISSRIAPKFSPKTGMKPKVGPGGFGVPVSPIAPRLSMPGEVPGKMLRFGFPGRKPSVSKEQGWDARVLRKATKGVKKQWEKVNKDPLVRGSALSAGARETDRSISARFKIAKSKDTVQKIRGKSGKIIKKVVKARARDTKDDYYKINQHKFRMWVQKGGKKKHTPNQFLERQPYRLDNPREVRTLQRARNVNPIFGRMQPQGSPTQSKKKKGRPFRL